MIVGAAAGVAIGQQCARRPLPLPTAFAKLAVASLLAAVSLALLAHAAGGELGNFGHVGVDQATFVPGAFFWFFVIGGLTVVMTGGISPRPKSAARTSQPVPVEDQPGPVSELLDLQSDAESELRPENPEEPRPEGTLEESEPQLKSGSQPESGPEPGPPPPPVKPAPNLDDVEDLMFVDADIELGDIEPADIEPGDIHPADDQPPSR